MYPRNYELVRKLYIYFEDITMCELIAQFLNSVTSPHIPMYQNSGVSNWKPIIYNQVDAL